MHAILKSAFEKTMRTVSQDILRQTCGFLPLARCRARRESMRRGTITIPWEHTMASFATAVRLANSTRTKSEIVLSTPFSFAPVPTTGPL